MTFITKLSSCVTLLSLLHSVTALPTAHISAAISTIQALEAPIRLVRKSSLINNLHKRQYTTYIDDQDYQNEINAYHVRLGLAIGLSIVILISSIWIRIIVIRRREARLRALQDAIIAASHGAPGTAAPRMEEQQMSQFPAPPYAPSSANINYITPVHAVPGTAITTDNHHVDSGNGLTTPSQAHMVDVPLSDCIQPQRQYPQPQLYQQQPPPSQH